MSQSLGTLHNAQIHNKTTNNNSENLEKVIKKKKKTPYNSWVRKLQTIIENFLEIISIRLSIENMKAYRSHIYRQIYSSTYLYLK